MTKSTVLCVSLAATCAASIYLWFQWNAELEANRDLRARIASLERRPAPAIVAVPGASRAAVPNGSAPVALIAPPLDAPSVAATSNYFRDSREQLLKNPEYRRALLARHRLSIENEYRDLPRYLHISADTTGRLFDLMAEHEVEKTELRAGWHANRQGAESPQSMMAELQAKQDAELSALIGGQNLAQLKDYGSNLESRLEVDALRAELARTSEPLREDQLEPMIALVSAENQRANQEQRDRRRAGAGLPPGVDTTDPDLAIAANDRIIDGSAMVLSSVQLAAVRDFYRRQRILMESQRDMARLQEETFTLKPN